ncbi:MAG TPA: DUF2244 domain-containing protein [Burkholderiaceae bacterium]|nr:DUF2244 domain-containing protein [Burkholderiaceae bacterium]
MSLASALRESDAAWSRSVRWSLARNCSLAPRQLAMGVGCLAVASLGVGLFFWMQGARLILAFTVLELTALTVACLVYARHATDGDRVFLNGPLLVVERERAGRVERTEFRRAGVRIEPASSDGSLIAVSGDGRQVMIGQFVRAEQRVQLARDMRRAVREDRTAFEGQSGVREADTRI